MEEEILEQDSKIAHNITFSISIYKISKLNNLLDVFFEKGHPLLFLHFQHIFFQLLLKTLK